MLIKQGTDTEASCEHKTVSNDYLNSVVCTPSVDEDTHSAYNELFSIL